MTEITKWREGEQPSDDELWEWIRTRPQGVHGLMIRFPPLCLVMRSGGDVDDFPRSFSAGVVTAYTEPNTAPPQGTLIVRKLHGDHKAECDPEAMTVIAYHRGVTPDYIKEVLHPAMTNG